MKIGLVHATLAAVQPMVSAFKQHAPGATLLHFLDEGLLPQVNREGLSPAAIGEVERLVNRAITNGADGVLLTCSAYSPVVLDLQRRLAAPVVSVDEAMLRDAVGRGTRIGVVATVAAAGPTTANALRHYATQAGRRVEVQVRVVTHAFAVLADEPARHDALVREQIEMLLPQSDVVVLAQISMARALASGPTYAKPVLTSPEVAIRALLSRLPQAAPAQ